MKTLQLTTGDNQHSFIGEGAYALRLSSFDIYAFL